MTLILGGFGNGDWLPILGVLLTLGFIVQCIDWSITYFKERRKRKRYQLEQTIINHSFSNDSIDNFSAN